MAATARHIMVIEPSDALRARYVATLAEAGYWVRGSATPAQCDAAIAEAPADIVVLDLTRPVLRAVPNGRAPAADALPIDPVALLDRHAALQRLAFGGLVIDALARTLHHGAQPIMLTRGEFTLLWLLASARGAVLTRDRLCNAVARTPADSDPRTADALVRRIRRKIEPVAGGGIVLTVPGLGYRLGAEVRAA
ncbi:winged helix-turn-helix transcriptional regulator [Sphingomonas baiyangensis]|uniref:Winged-helix domain-containing protein n=1 Tax=Sphingomonas baiyangensis TaxID=2572576 RepID=A0A4U1L535_9SPHN|nr:winged-helix domain-containing protein [Sphingomonas baiyangensis]TKD52041.1 winged-helix domain-containing protein [Sphingomonas baiyangensis]